MSQGKIKNADINSAAAIDRAKLAAGTANGVVVNDSGGALSSVAPGTSGNVLKSDGTSWVSGAAGLTNWTDAANSSAPNATVPVVSLTATNAATNVDAALVAKGTGATLAQVSDGTNTGGNKRGTYATDWGKARSDPAQVASGAYAVIGGGNGNLASGSRSTVGGGGGNQATNTSATVAGGTSCTASGSESTVGGGDTNSATGMGAAIAGGKTNVANSIYSAIPGGEQATTRSVRGRFSFASGAFSTTGDAQMGILVTRRSTTDATPTVLTSTGGAASSTNVNVLPNSAAYMVEVQLVARNTSTGDAAMWLLQALVTRGASAATTAIVGSVLGATALAASAGAASWAATLIADTTLGAVEVQGTGAAATTIHWTATMFTTEVL